MSLVVGTFRLHTDNLWSCFHVFKIVWLTQCNCNFRMEIMTWCYRWFWWCRTPTSRTPWCPCSWWWCLMIRSLQREGLNPSRHYLYYPFVFYRNIRTSLIYWFLLQIKPWKLNGYYRFLHYSRFARYPSKDFTKNSWPRSFSRQNSLKR